MIFYNDYTTKPGDNLFNIAKSNGYLNPGPIVYCSGNQGVFSSNFTPNRLLPGLKFRIPWHPDLLRKFIATSTYLIRETAHFASQLVQEQIQSKGQIDSYLMQIDAINFLAGVMSGVGSLSVQGAKGIEMSSSEAITWLIESRVTIASNITTLVVPSPNAPRKDFKFYIRHALGPWNPSYWVTVYEAIKEGDIDLYLYGSDAIAYKNALRIKQQADRDIDRLQARVSQAFTQLSMPFYYRQL